VEFQDSWMSRRLVVSGVIRTADSAGARRHLGPHRSRAWAPSLLAGLVTMPMRCRLRLPATVRIVVVGMLLCVSRTVVLLIEMLSVF
jgi:hypothetical protein